MSDQPIIIEDEADVRPQAGKQQINQELFYELLDEVEQYDRISTSIRQKYQEAMVQLASVKFNSPNFLNVSSQKCVPAFLKVSSEGNLVYDYTQYKAKVDHEEVYPDEYEEHEQIQQYCLSKQAQLSQSESLEQRQVIVENELLRRFNVGTKQQKILDISKQFKTIIELLLELQSFKVAFEPKLQGMQKH